jgi:hypothetical protein
MRLTVLARAPVQSRPGAQQHSVRPAKIPGSRAGVPSLVLGCDIAAWSRVPTTSMPQLGQTAFHRCVVIWTTFTLDQSTPNRDRPFQPSGMVRRAPCRCDEADRP